MGAHEVVELTQKEFADLPEYSCSLPTGTTIGKRWKKNIHAHPDSRDVAGCAEAQMVEEWYLGEYVEDPDPKLVGICWRKIELKK